MSAYTNQNIDFVFRTQQILKQYENIKKNRRTDGYEFTLLMNCFVGLLIIPQQINERRRGNVPSPADILSETDIIDENNFGINPNDIVICVGIGRLNVNDKSLRNVVRHFRHSVAHSRFEVLSNNGIISSVIFRDNDSNDNPTFELELSIEKIHKFANKISDCFLDVMANDIESGCNFEQYKEKNKNKYRDINDIDIY